MRLFNHVVATLLVISALNGFTLFPPVLAAEAPEPRKTAEQTGEAGLGWVMGIVMDSMGAPLESTLVSVTGPAGISLAVCDPTGRFEFLGLSPGTYLLRVHSRGFAVAKQNVIQVSSGLATVHNVTLLRTVVASPAPEFLAAGFRSSRGFLGSFSSLGLVAQPDGTGSVEDDGLPGTSADGSDFATGRVTPHDDSEKAWRLRRARRSVLKDSVFDLVREGKESDSPFVGQTLPMAADRITMNPVPSGFPFSGQLHLLTRAMVRSSSDLLSTDILPGQIAYVSLGGLDQKSHWGLRGAVRTGNAGTLALAGTYVTEMSDSHVLALGLSYSRQNHQTAAIDRSFPPSPIVLDEAVTAEESGRGVGGVSVRGAWDVSPRMRIDYGAGVAKYEYLEENGLVSPNMVVTVQPLQRTRIRVAVSQNMFAPGGEEFLPRSEGMWLPPETTFALLSPNDPLSAERSQHVEVAVEHDVARVSTISVRRFYQEVDSQMVTLFGVGPQLPVSSSKHYYVMSGSAVRTEGWGLMFSHTLAGRIRGAIDYSLMHAEWAPWAVSGSFPQMVGVFRTGNERFHDVTTSVETGIPETATEVFVRYRVSTAFSVKDRATESLTSGLDGRFSLRVKQALPFSPFEGSEWEVLVDIRSLFHEPVVGASVYDELLVANPPKQFVGGLVVHF